MVSPIFTSKSEFSFVSVFRGAELCIIGIFKCLSRLDLSDSGTIFSLVKLSVVTEAVSLLSVYLFKLAVQHDEVASLYKFDSSHIVNLTSLLLGMLNLFSPSVEDLFWSTLKHLDPRYNRKRIRPLRLTRKGIIETMLLSMGLEPKSSACFDDFLVDYANTLVAKICIWLVSKVHRFGYIPMTCVVTYIVNNIMGVEAAFAMFIGTLVVPFNLQMGMLSGYWASQRILLDALEPFFDRMQFSKEQRKLWMASRAGILLGFSMTSYLLVQIPGIGIPMFYLVNGSAAYMVTQVSEPPFEPRSAWLAKQLVWKEPLF